MLSVSNLFKAFLALSVSVSLHATDVFGFDIKGIKLGESYNHIKSKINGCSEVTIDIGGNKRITAYLRCGKTLNSSTQEFTISFDNHGKIIQIERYKYFKTEPFFKKIKTQLFTKYGKPDKKANANSTSGNSNYTFSWGDYRIESHNGNQYWSGSTIRIPNMDKPY